MNPGAIEHAAKAAVTFMESMRAHPLALALVIMNVGLLVIVYLELDQVFRQQREINALLSKCVDPDVLKALGILK